MYLRLLGVSIAITILAGFVTNYSLRGTSRGRRYAFNEENHHGQQNLPKNEAELSFSFSYQSWYFAVGSFPISP